MFYAILLLDDREVNYQRGKYDGNHRQQLDEDVYKRQAESYAELYDWPLADQPPRR